MGLGGRALQPLGRLTKSTHAGSWSYRSSPPSRLASRHHDDTDPGFGLVARKCQLYRRLYMRTDPVQDGCHVTRQPGSDTVRTKDRLRITACKLTRRATLEGSNHIDRDAQFEYINTQAKSFIKSKQPVISADTKKKEMVGTFRNNGREW